MNIENEYNFKLFDSFPEMYFLLSEEGKILQMNSVAREVLNKKHKSENFIQIFDLVELCDRTEAQNIFQRCLKEKRSKQYQTRFFVNRKLIDVNLTFVNPDNSIDNPNNSTISFARDITKEKQKEVDLMRFHNIEIGRASCRERV